MVSFWLPWTAEEGDTARILLKGLGFALGAKMRADQAQAFKEIKNSQAFTVGRKNKFCTSRFQVLQGMFVQSFAQIFEELTA